MKKSIKILSGGLAFLLIIVILYFANGLLGNPISKTVANNVSKEYIAKNYPNLKLRNLHIQVIFTLVNWVKIC